jgi:hypothetical protein
MNLRIFWTSDDVRPKLLQPRLHFCDLKPLAVDVRSYRIRIRKQIDSCQIAMQPAIGLLGEELGMVSQRRQDLRLHDIWRRPGHQSDLPQPFSR